MWPEKVAVLMNVCIDKILRGVLYFINKECREVKKMKNINNNAEVITVETFIKNIGADKINIEKLIFEQKQLEARNIMFIMNNKKAV